MDVFGVCPDLDVQVYGSLYGQRASTSVADVHGTIWELDALPDIRGDVLKVNKSGCRSDVETYDDPPGIVNSFTNVHVDFIVTMRKDVDGFRGRIAFYAAPQSLERLE